MINDDEIGDYVVTLPGNYGYLASLITRESELDNLLQSLKDYLEFSIRCIEELQKFREELHSRRQNNDK